MTVYGYVRVSSKEQNPERQLAALKKRGVNEKNIFLDKLSGKDFDRPEYKRLLRQTTEGDLIVIKCIDRLGRNYDEILQQWRLITKTRCVNIEVLDMPLLNTAVGKDGLTGVFISDLVLQILAYVAETERDFIKQRQREGIDAALERGVHFGRPKTTVSSTFNDAFTAWLNGEVSTREGALYAGMSHSTFYRRCKEFETFV